MRAFPKAVIEAVLVITKDTNIRLYRYWWRRLPAI